MSLEVYINTNKLELLDQKKLGITFQVNTLGDLQSRQANYSNQFRIPKTAINNKILQYANNLNTNTGTPYESNTAKIIQDGVEIVPSGVAVINSVDDEFYYIQITSGNKNFFQLIDKLLLTDLDLSAYDHTYDSSIVSSNEINVDGYCYPEVFWNKKTTTSPARRIPMVFIATLVKAIAAKVGYLVAGNVLSNIDYCSTLLSVNFRQTVAWIEDKESKSTHSNFDYHDIISTPATYVYPFYFPNVGYIIGNQYNVPEAMYANFSFSVSITFGGTFGGAAYTELRVQIVELISATVITSIPHTFSSGEISTIAAGGTVDVEFTGDTGFISTNTPAQYQIRMEADAPAIGQYYFTVNGGSVYQAQVKDIIIPYGGSAINFSKIQHNIKCTDFLKGIFNLFNITSDIDDYSKTLILTQQNDLEKNKATANDWSSKVDTGKQITIQYRDTNFAQKNFIKFSNDGDIADEYKLNATFWKTVYGEHYLADNVTLDPAFYGSGFIDINDQNLQPSKDVIQLPFAASNGQYIPVVNNDYSVDTFTPRVMILGYWQYSSIAAFNNYAGDAYGVTRCLSFSTYYPFGRINDYSTLTKIFDQYKKITLHLRLNQKDISELNFMTPVFLNIQIAQNLFINGYFYLNTINNYKPQESTKVELIRI